MRAEPRLSRYGEEGLVDGNDNWKSKRCADRDVNTCHSSCASVLFCCCCEKSQMMEMETEFTT